MEANLLILSCLPRAVWVRDEGGFGKTTSMASALCVTTEKAMKGLGIVVGAWGTQGRGSGLCLREKLRWKGVRLQGKNRWERRCSWDRGWRSWQRNACETWQEMLGVCAISIHNSTHPLARLRDQSHSLGQWNESEGRYCNKAQCGKGLKNLCDGQDGVCSSEIFF